MLQDRKFWSKNDEMYIGDTKDNQNPTDCFKTNRDITKRKKENLEKALTKAYIDPHNVCKTKK